MSFYSTTSTALQYSRLEKKREHTKKQTMVICDVIHDSNWSPAIIHGYAAPEVPQATNIGLIGFYC